MKMTSRNTIRSIAVPLNYAYVFVYYISQNNPCHDSRFSLASYIHTHKHITLTHRALLDFLFTLFLLIFCLTIIITLIDYCSKGPPIVRIFKYFWVE